MSRGSVFGIPGTACIWMRRPYAASAGGSVSASRSDLPAWTK
jgi:hypothetical protein